MVALWRKDLQKINPKAAESLADPGQYANLFPGMDLALQAEQLQVKSWLGRFGAADPAPCFSEFCLGLQI